MPRNLYTKNEIVLCTYIAMYGIDNINYNDVSILNNRSIDSIKMKVGNIVSMLDEKNILRYSNFLGLTGVSTGKNGRQTNWSWIEPIVDFTQEELLRQCQLIISSINITQADSNIPNDITVNEIKKATYDFDNKITKHRFVDSRDYDVIIDGNRYPPKAIIGLASYYTKGELLTPAHFSAGIGKKCFRILEENGFPIVPKDDISTLAEEVNDKDVYFEGSVKTIKVNRYERDKKARDKCIEYYGLKCQVCDFDFYEKYGELGVGFIHVHHEIPISSIQREYIVDPIKDLKPVCPNCHAMLHKSKIPLSIAALRSKLK